MLSAPVPSIWGLHSGDLVLGNSRMWMKGYIVCMAASLHLRPVDPHETYMLNMHGMVSALVGT